MLGEEGLHSEPGAGGEALVPLNSPVISPGIRTMVLETGVPRVLFQDASYSILAV